MLDSVPKWIRQPEKRPAQIMLAALDVFARRGYRAATMEEIARAAGVTKGTIYLYFSGKEDLFIQTLQSQAAELAALLPEFRFMPGDPPQAHARAFAQAVLEILMAPGMVKTIPLFIAEMRHHPALRRLYIEEWLPRAGLGLAEMLRAGMEAGVVRTLDPVITARAITGMFSTFAITQEVFGLKEITPMTTEEIAETIVSIALQGILVS